MVIIRNTKTKREVFGHRFIAKAEQDEKSRHWIYRLDPDLRAFYGEMSHTLIDWEQRLRSKAKISRAGCNYISPVTPAVSGQGGDAARTQRQPYEGVKEFRRKAPAALDDLVRQW